MRFAGVDIGSLSAKAVILGEDNRILGHAIVLTGASSRKAGVVCFEEVLRPLGLKVADINYIVSTGYGREMVAFANAQVTEITCHAAGAHFTFPEVRTIIDIGGQDSKVIRVNAAGKVINFAMNDKCAAGTGRFLEVMARALEVDLDEMGEFSLRSTKEVSVSSMCTVFAESEVISLIASGSEKEDIIAGLHRSIAKRMMGLLERVGVEQKVAMSGGVAKNIGVVRALEIALGTSLLIPKEPQIIGALGAALIARDKYAALQQDAAAARR